MARRSSGSQQSQLKELDDRDERDGIGKDAGNVEELEEQVDLEADAATAAQQFDHQHDLPDDGQARTCGRNDEGTERWQDHMAQRLPPTELKYLCHLEQVATERSRSLAHGDDDIGNLVDRHSQDRGCLGEVRTRHSKGRWSQAPAG